MRSITLFALLLLLVSCTQQAPEPPSQFDPLDFRYRPHAWTTGIGLPYDWLKTVVTQDAALGYDYAPGPYAQPLTEVHLRGTDGDYRLDTIRWSDATLGAVEADFRSGNGSNSLHLKLMRYVDPNAPRVPHASGSSDDVATHDSAPNPSLHAPALLRESQVRRRETHSNMAMGWAQPGEGVDPLFRNVAWGPNRAVVYEVAVPKGASRTIALGWADSRYEDPKARVLLGIVEGARTQEVSPIGEAGKNGPVVRTFNARDVDGDGWIRIESAPSPNGHDPNPFLNGIWMFAPGTAVSDADLISGAARERAELVVDCGNDTQWFEPGTTDLMAGTFAKAAPSEVFVKTGRTLAWDEASGSLQLEGRPMVTSVPAATGFRQVDGGYVMTLPEASEVLVAVHHGANPISISSLDDAVKAETALHGFWTHHRDSIPFPYHIPDPTLQQVLEVNRDNIYRMADWVEGHHTWHTGPSVYRGIWLGDATTFIQNGLFTLDSTGARLFVESIARYRLPNGQISVMVPHVLYRETAHYLIQMALYADLSGNDQWLLNRWDHIQKGMAFLKGMRTQTLRNPNAVNYGLMPEGFSDGGLAGVGGEYGSVYFTLMGAKFVLRTAERMGKSDDPEVREWQQFFDDAYASFRKAAARDMQKDGDDWFLPMRVGETDTTVRPTMAQWGVVEAMSHVELFDKTDSLAVGTMNILTKHVTQGLAIGTGWLPEGLWPWFSSMQAPAHLNMDQPEEAIPLFYAITNHASPLGTWVEEQLPKYSATPYNGGDQSNAAGSGLYLIQLRRMLINERNDGLHLFPAVPAEWFGPGDVVAIDRSLTVYGQMKLRSEVSADGKTLTLKWELQPHAGRPTPVMHLHTDAFAAAGFDVSGAGEIGPSGEVVFRK